MRNRAIAAAALLSACAVLAAAAPPTAPPLPSETRLIDVGGRRAAFHVYPGRAPTVVFEAGAGMDGTAWSPVLDTIRRATGARMITFDRAGFGDSDEDRRPLTLQHEVDDLGTGLSQLGANRDLVFVAHSFGGEVALSFASQNPGRVAWAVLVDASIPSFFTDTETAAIVAAFPKNMETTDKQGRAMSAMFRAFPAMQHAFHAMSWPADVPATVIVSEHPPFATPDQQALWTADHVRFAHAAANRTVLIAARSGHIVMTDRPDIVAHAVIEAVERVRRSAAR